LVSLPFACRNTGALCAMKEVNIIPDDAKSVESLKQLEQVVTFDLPSEKSTCCFLLFRNRELHFFISSLGFFGIFLCYFPVDFFQETSFYSVTA
jgi:hypothetical protein